MQRNRYIYIYIYILLILIQTNINLFGMTYVVNSTADDVQNPPPNTLRWAINKANDFKDFDQPNNDFLTIQFSFSSAETITLQAPLPSLNNGLIDGGYIINNPHYPVTIVSPNGNPIFNFIIPNPNPGSQTISISGGNGLTLEFVSIDSSTDNNIAISTNGPYLTVENITFNNVNLGISASSLIGFSINNNSFNNSFGGIQIGAFSNPNLCFESLSVSGNTFNASSFLSVPIMLLSLTGTFANCQGSPIQLNNNILIGGSIDININSQININNNNITGGSIIGNTFAQTYSTNKVTSGNINITGDNNTIVNNTIIGGNMNIGNMSINANGNTINNNTIESFGSINVTGNKNTGTGNNITNGTISISGNGNSIDQSTVTSNLASASENGINLLGENNTISNSRVTGFKTAIAVSGLSNLILGNKITNFDISGIGLMEGKDCFVSKNTIQGTQLSSAGILVLDSTKNKLSENLIGYANFGIHFRDTDNENSRHMLEKNILGFDPDGNPAPLRISAIHCGKRAHTNIAKCNTIAHSGKGITADTPSAIHNTFSANSISQNASKGIGLTNGANDDQAFPVLNSAQANGNTIIITGTLTSLPNTTFRIEFFRNPVDRNPITEGKDPLGSVVVKTDANGFVSFTARVLSADTTGFVSSTATVLDGPNTGDTSEFSLNIPITAGGTPQSAIGFAIFKKYCASEDPCAGI